MARLSKVMQASSGEVTLSGAAVFQPLPPADDTEKVCLPIADALLAPDEAVRWQARNLRDAIDAARAEGFVVNLPFRIDDLDRIAISATGKAT